MDIFSLSLLFAISLGQLIKIPIGLGGITILDLTVTALTIFGMARLKSKLENPPKILKLAVLFILICIVSLIFTPLSLSKSEYLISFSYILRLFIYFLFGWILYRGAFPSIQKNILKISIYSGIIISVIGILQFIFFPDLEFLTENRFDPHYFRVVSTFLDPNFAGAYLVLTLLLIYNFGLTFFKQIGRKIIFLICFIALLATFSRGAYLMFAASFLSLAFLIKSKRLLAATVFFSFCLGLAFNWYTNYIARIRNIDREKSAQYRINAWTQGWEIFSKNPIFGVGFNAYRFAIREYRLAPDQFVQSRGASTNDSSLLYIGATTGIVGLAIFILLLSSLFIYSVKTPSANKYILPSALIGLLIHSLFANSLFYPFLLIWIILYLSKSPPLRGQKA